MELGIKEIYSYMLESFEELNSILDEERLILIENKGEELLKLVEDKKIVVKKISLLEEKRIQLTNNMGAENVILNGYATREQIDKLKELTKEIQYKNETNKMLTKQSLHYIQAIRFALAPNENRVTTYGNQGKIGERTSDSIFSTKL